MGEKGISGESGNFLGDLTGPTLHKLGWGLGSRYHTHLGHTVVVSKPATCSVSIYTHPGERLTAG